MIVIRSLLLAFWLGCITHAADVTVIEKLGEDVFPADFSFGVATAAYQIEGGWDADGKGPSIWDTFTHNHPEKIADRSNGDVGPDSYHLFDEDLKALKELGVNFYRFSISWSRILPSGDISRINPRGIYYYNDVIDKLVQNGIEPIVTMYHYDLPEELQKIGGFASPIIIKYFESYADLLFQYFGDRVKTWITINEPYNFCVLGYGSDVFPPAVNASGIGEYLCMHHILKAHALVYRIYKDKYYKVQRGRIGITLSSRYFYSKENDADIVERALQFMLGWAANPIFGKEGGYPDVMVRDVERNSLNEGRTSSRLPTLSTEWKETIKGTSDFLGLNYYTSRIVERAKLAINTSSSITLDSETQLYADENWDHAKSKWIHYVPEGLELLLKWIKEKYGNVEIIITENGWSDDGELDDRKRVRYLIGHLRAVRNAMNNGCNITGYTYWSLIDNFEWREGYTEKFGLYHVDLKSDKKERTPKRSADIYASIIKSRRTP